MCFPSSFSTLALLGYDGIQITIGCSYVGAGIGATDFVGCFDQEATVSISIVNLSKVGHHHISKHD
jgi:hypothetical protein